MFCVCLQLYQRAALQTSAVKDERARLRAIRLKVEAALTIQLAWRRWKHRCEAARSKAALRSRPAAMIKASVGKRATASKASVASAKAPSTTSATPSSDRQLLQGAAEVGASWQRQIAALTIQLAWRKYQRRKLQSAASSIRSRQSLAPKAYLSQQAQLQRTRVNAVYNHTQPMLHYKPRRSSMHRPTYFTDGPSPASGWPFVKKFWLSWPLF